MPIEREESLPAGAYRAAPAAGPRLLFGATFGCPACRLRFARRSACPACGATDVVSLADRDGRATYRARARERQTGGGVLGALAPWAPTRLAIPVGLALLLIAPAALGYLFFGRSAFENLWLTSDLTTKYEGLSKSGLVGLALAAAGVLLLGFVLLAKVGAAQVSRVTTTPRRMRVHTAPSAGDAAEVRGIARLGTVEITSALASTACLAFGLCGATDAAEIADAEGGDFDLELPSGERMMVSLEHAVLCLDAPGPTSHPVDDALEELLEDRAIATKVGAPIMIEEHVLRDGDPVTVVATILGGGAVTLANGSRARVLAGSEEHPLAIRVG